MTGAPTLFDVYTVHCFTCPHTVTALDPITAHDEMETHYSTRHRPLIASLVGELVP